MDSFHLVPLVVFLPLAGFLLNIAIGRRLGERGSALIAIAAVFGAFVVAVLQALSLAAHPHGAAVPLADWINIGSLQVPWGFQVDTLSVTMMLVVSGVGTLIHIYASGYMFYDVRYKEDPASYTRFFIYLNLFIAAMMVLVSGNSYLMLFVGWEGVGLCSFLLIGFWYNRNPDGKKGFLNSQAAKKAFVANRVGDFGFLIAVFAIFWAFGSLKFDEVLPLAGTVAPAVILLITLALLLGVTGKSAQLPLYVWLPDAMAGPTPVSALIHAATMVTAGVYLVARSAPLFAVSPVAQTTVAVVGGLTALFAASIAVAQTDIKKVLAYSTISQLGFMVAAVGMGAFVAGMFHLVTHAFFKALLFMGSGSVILALERAHHPLEDDPYLPKKKKKKHDEHHAHGHLDPQDMRIMGGLRKQIPVTYWVYMIGAVALAGLPPLAGFFSKDEILTDALHANVFVYVLLTAAAFLTAFYMGRQMLMVFFGQPRSDAAAHAVESPPVVTVPLMVLAALSAFGGLLNFPGWHPLTDWLEHTLGHDLAHATVFNPGVAAFSTLLAGLAIYLSWQLYGRQPLKERQADPLKKRLGWLYKAMENKWWVDELYFAIIINPYKRMAAFLADKVDWDFWHDWVHDTLIAKGFRGLAHFLANPVDLGVIDGLANGLAKTAQGLGRGLSLLQNGLVRNYALVTFLGVVIMIGYLVFSS
ncbi:MAG: NADH-quinone oxidoreductase subunit L [Anaerolineales bacterium]|nr:NADH-quinone oxidoreductase subunit L [Anaerolineales bacterium]MCW5855126.1 NADH-quinone oxidoreductase subunit L [Anaerolineales bacterium]